MRFRIRKISPLIFALYFATASSVLSASQWPPTAEVTERVDAAGDMLNELVKAMPVDLSDTGNLADKLDYEIEVAHHFVRDQIRYEPYLGVLKGPRGTAATLAGNSWDQAVLLANLINIMGGEAQLVTGSLDSASAGLLLQQVFQTHKRQDDAAVASALTPILAKYNPQLAELFQKHSAQSSADEDEKVLRADTRGLSDLLLELVALPTDPGNDADVLKRLTEKLASSYVWVRWRDGPSQPWQALHPVFVDGQVPVTTESGVLTGKIPLKFQHRLTISMSIERQVSIGNIETESIMDDFSRPTAQLFKKNLVIGMGPAGGAPGSGADAAFVLPFLQGKLAPGAKAVNVLGLTADASVALQPGSGDYFATLSETVGSALGGLNNADAEEGAPAIGPLLTGVVLQFTLQGPGFEAQTVERRLSDYRDGPKPEFPASFSFNSVVVVNIGAETGSRIARQFIQQQANVVSALPLQLGVAKGILPYEEARRLPEFQSLPTASWLSADLAGGSLTPPGVNDTVVSRPSAFVIVRHTKTQASGQLLTYSDVVFNPAVALHRDANNVITSNSKAVLEQGVRETLFESKLMYRQHGWSERKPESVLGSVAELSTYVAKAGWSSAAAEMAAKDIENGFKLLVTNASEHWWRVDPLSGSTLGMGPLGGQDATAMVTLLLTSALSSYFFYLSVESCDETYAGDQAMADCCIVGNLAMTYGSAGVGGAGGAAMAEGEIAKTAVAHSWSAALGEITAALSFEVTTNIITGAATAKPLDSICRSYLEK